jgi:hypothetical protein
MHEPDGNHRASRAAPGRRGHLALILPAPILAVVLATCPACSFTVRGPDPKAPPSAAPDCTREADGRLALDVLPAAVASTAALGLLAIAVSLAFDDDCRSGGELSGLCGLPAGLALLSAAAATPYLLAIGYSRRKTRACQAAWTRHEAWRATQPRAEVEQERQDRPPAAAEEEKPAAEHERSLREDRDRAADHPECIPILARWRGERDLGRKTAQYERMPERCRRLITRER